LDQLREYAKEIFYHGLKQVDPVVAIKKYVRRNGHKLIVNGNDFDLVNYNNIYVIGMGKASAAMAKGLEEVLGTMITGGIINVKYGHSLPLENIKVIEASHPVPDKSGVKGTYEIVDLLKQTNEKDLIFCLISGGGSALLPAPPEPITLEDKQKLTDELLKCGAKIHEINIIRKQLSNTKGGKLAHLAYPSTLISLILSDVIGDDLDIIASGPTAPDTSCTEDCYKIIDKYRLNECIPNSIKSYFEQKNNEQIPHPRHPCFENTHNIIIGSNIQALLGAKEKAVELGFETVLLSSFIEGETEDVAKVHTAIVKEIISTGNPINIPACILSGGETTVSIEHDGLGGRNQEFALAAAIEIENIGNVLVLSAGTDGTDGPTDAAGAFADGSTVKRASEAGMDACYYLARNDSYNFFETLSDLFITGPTYTNVMDMRIILIN